MKTVVDVLYGEYQAFYEYFKANNETSFQISMENHLKKGLLLASASYFESIITNELIVFTSETTGSNEVICSFLKNKAISRQYHTLFQWDQPKGANTFFGLLGDGFKTYMKKNIQESKKLSDSIDAFLNIGDERNRLVHLNYGTYTVPKTIDEIYSLYNNASYFVNVLPDCLRLKFLEINKE
jgi:hypothetical protein